MQFLLFVSQTHPVLHCQFALDSHEKVRKGLDQSHEYMDEETNYTRSQKRANVAKMMGKKKLRVPTYLVVCVR